MRISTGPPISTGFAAYHTVTAGSRIRPICRLGQPRTSFGSASSSHRSMTAASIWNAALQRMCEDVDARLLPPTRPVFERVKVSKKRDAARTITSFETCDFETLRLRDLNSLIPI